MTSHCSGGTSLWRGAASDRTFQIAKSWFRSVSGRESKIGRMAAVTRVPAALFLLPIPLIHPAPHEAVSKRLCAIAGRFKAALDVIILLVEMLRGSAIVRQISATFKRSGF